MHSPLEQQSSRALVYHFNIGHLIPNMWWPFWHEMQLKQTLEYLCKNPAFRVPPELFTLRKCTLSHGLMGDTLFRMDSYPQKASWPSGSGEFSGHRERLCPFSEGAKLPGVMAEGKVEKRTRSTRQQNIRHTPLSQRTQDNQRMPRRTNTILTLKPTLLASR